MTILKILKGKSRQFIRPARFQPRRGAVLVEFALIALTMYILIAAVIEFGRLMHGAQTLQAAADLAARELSRVPLSASLPTLDAAMTASEASPTYGDHAANARSHQEDLVGSDATRTVGAR